ncbi:MAG TPA: LptA/OstA family protein [Aestuariivirga sp.]|nr:LptA/OstA family protein [Aestuariivirga sp.]
MTRTITAAALALVLLGVPAPIALAQTAEEVNIEAAEMEIIDANKTAVFRGDVVATRGGETLRSQEMTVTYTDVKQPDGTTKTQADVLDATGGVTITTAKQTITAAQARINIGSDKLVASGNVKVVQGKTVLRGEKLTTDLKGGHSVMSGGRVKGTFVPR